MKTVYFILALLFSVSLLAQTPEERHFMDSLANRPTALIGHPIPPFAAYSVSGKPYSNYSLRNKITLINFWFEACVPCMVEMEYLNQLYSYFSKNESFQFLSFTYDKREAVERVISKHHIKFPVIPVSMDSCFSLNMNSGFPTTFISDANGKIAFFSEGGSLRSEEAQDSIKKNIYPVLERLLQKIK